MKGKRSFAALLSALLVLALCALPLSNPVQAAGNKTVRVGYMIYEGYQEGGPGEAKSGSAYEYYQKLRYYTGWEYQYFYGSISDMFEMLARGEIDIMSMVTYTDERAERYAFSDEPHSMEAFYLYTLVDENRIQSDDLHSLDGRRVGVTLDSYQETYLRKWCLETRSTATSSPMNTQRISTRR